MNVHPPPLTACSRRRIKRFQLESLESRRLLSSTMAVFSYEPASTGNPIPGVSVSHTMTGTANDWLQFGAESGQSLNVNVQGLPEHSMVRVSVAMQRSTQQDYTGDSDKVVASMAGRSVELITSYPYPWPEPVGSESGSNWVGRWIQHTEGDLDITLSAADCEANDAFPIWGIYVQIYQPTISLSGGGTIAEDATGAATFTVSRDLPADYGSVTDDEAIPDTTVNMSTSGTATADTDYTASPAIGSTIVLGSSQAGTQIAVTPKKDNLVESTETLGLSLSSGSGYSLDGANASATLSISDDPPVVSITATDDSAAEPDYEGGTPDTGTFRISRSGGDLTAALTVGYTMAGTATEGDDYTLTGSATIAANASFTDITLTPLLDEFGDGSKTAIMTLTTSTSYNGGGSSAEVMVNGTPFSITSSESPVEATSGAVKTFTVTLLNAGAVDGVTAVAVAISGGNNNDTVAIGGANLAGERTVTLTVPTVGPRSFSLLFTVGGKLMKNLTVRVDW
jgi:hypothetical protein